MMYKIGLSTCGKKIDRTLFEQYRKAGIAAMEISPKPEEYADIDYDMLKQLSEECGVELWSYHLPFGDTDVSDKERCTYSLRYFEELIQKASAIGIKRFIVHPSGEPIAEEERLARMQCSKENLAALAEIAKKYDAVIAVEDLPRTCLGRNSDEIAELNGAHDNLRVCFDTNHLLKEDPIAFIHKIGNKIITTHVSDYDFVDEKHWLPGEGKVDWSAMLQALRDVEYDGVWMYEAEFKCPRSIIRNRDLTCEDFARNAAELFADKEITVLSAQKEN